jgi:hypothetical protein
MKDIFKSEERSLGLQEVKWSSLRQIAAILLHPVVDKSKYFLEDFKGLRWGLKFIIDL